MNQVVLDTVPLNQLVHGDAIFIGNQPDGITGFHRVIRTSSARVRAGIATRATARIVGTARPGAVAVRVIRACCRFADD